MKNIIIILISLVLLLSCRSKKESVYSWKGEEESRELTLLKNNTFILSIKTDYYSRLDTGFYEIRGDTLIINPGKRGTTVDSVYYVDSGMHEQRYVEVNEEEIEFDTNNVAVNSFYRTILFPSVKVNDTLPLSVSPDDATFRKLVIPDSVSVRRLTVEILEENTCKPRLKYHLDVPVEEANQKSYLLFIHSRKSQNNYLSGFKWLIRGDTIFSNFANENCDPVGIKLISQR